MQHAGELHWLAACWLEASNEWESRRGTALNTGEKAIENLAVVQLKIILIAAAVRISREVLKGDLALRVLYQEKETRYRLQVVLCMTLYECRPFFLVRISTEV